MNEAERLVGYLNGRDAPCPGCGYNLRGLKGTACPECGERLTLRGIKHPERRSALTPAFVVGSAGLVVGWLVALRVVGGMFSPGPTRFRRLVDFIGLHDRDERLFDGLVLGAAAAVLALASAKWIDWSDELAQGGARRRWAWAGACWLGPVLAWGVGWIVRAW